MCLRDRSGLGHSPQEAGIVAANTAVRAIGIPAMPLWDDLLSRKVKMTFHEDNQAAIYVCKNGRNPTSRTLGRTHGVCVAWLHENFTNGHFDLIYEKTDAQAADIFTKGFTDQVKWEHACRNINHVDPAIFWASCPPARGDSPPPSEKPHDTKSGKRNNDKKAVENAHHKDAGGQNAQSDKAVKSGDKFVITEEDHQKLCQALGEAQWYPQSRKFVSGNGTCLGATFDVKGPRLGTMSYRCKELIVLVNDIIRRTIGDKLFYWGSLQVNEDSVSQVHADKLNKGLSLCILAGKFTGGALKMKDGSLKCVTPR